MSLRKAPSPPSDQSLGVGARDGREGEVGAGERSECSDFDVLRLHHLGEGLLDPEDGKPRGRVVRPALGHQLQHGSQALEEGGKQNAKMRQARLPPSYKYLVTFHSCMWTVNSKQHTVHFLFSTSNAVLFFLHQTCSTLTTQRART